MNIEDAFTEEAIGTLSELDEEDQAELRRIAAKIYSDNEIVDVDSTIEVCVLFFVAGEIYANARAFTVEMDRDTYAAWTAFQLERERDG